jgi:glycosyl transferase family 2/tetratricopeptide repeat protein
VFGWLRRTGAKRSQERGDEVDRLYLLASDALRAGALPEAERYSRAAVALAPELPALHYLLGAVLLDRGRHAAALAALEGCLERNPEYPLAHHARARLAMCRMRTAPYDPPLEPLLGAAPKVSVVICSITPEKFERVSSNYSLRLRGVPHEIVGIHDARSLAEGYNRGVRKAHGDILVFSHDDIEIFAPDFAARLVNRLGDLDVIGLAGTDRVCGGSWVDAGWPHVFGQVGMRAPDGIIAGTYLLRGTCAAPMQALDGVFFACRRAVADAVPFDERTFDSWHLYDLDFTYSAFKAGFRLGVGNDLLIVHDSAGSFGESWLGHARRFMSKHGLPAPERYAFKGAPYCPVMTKSVQEWRLFTHYMAAAGA